MKKEVYSINLLIGIVSALGFILGLIQEFGIISPNSGILSFSLGLCLGYSLDRWVKDNFPMGGSMLDSVVLSIFDFASSFFFPIAFFAFGRMFAWMVYNKFVTEVMHQGYTVDFKLGALLFGFGSSFLTICLYGYLFKEWIRESKDGSWSNTEI